MLPKHTLLPALTCVSVPSEMLAGHSVGRTSSVRCWRSADVISVRQLTGEWGVLSCSDSPGIYFTLHRAIWSRLETGYITVQFHFIYRSERCQKKKVCCVSRHHGNTHHRQHHVRKSRAMPGIKIANPTSLIHSNLALALLTADIAY